MGSRCKHKRANRRSRSSNSHHGNDDADADAEIVHNHDSHQAGGEEVVHNPDSPTEQELANTLLINLKFFYTVALSTLCHLGYQESIVIQAMLNNGHCCGEKDILSNILHNTCTYLTTGKTDEFVTFLNLKQLLDLSLAAMVSDLVQKSNPHKSKRDAMMYLSINDLNLTPSVKDSLLRIAAKFTREFRANSEKLQTQENDCSNTSLSNCYSFADFQSGPEALVEQNEQLQDAKSEDVVSSMLDGFRDMKLDEKIKYVPLDPEEDEFTIDLLEQVKDLERQVKERKAWAQQKALQAERKLCDDQRELDMLRMEREDRKRKVPVLEGSTRTRIRSMNGKMSDMENAQTKAIEQLRGIDAALRQCEFECAEISAEFKASELTTLESVRTCVEVAKREKNCLKRLSVGDKQNAKLHDEIASVKQEILQLETQLVRVEAAQEEAQAKWKEAQKAKQLALVQLEEDMFLLKTTKVNNKREHEALRLKIETDFQHHKDDLQRLEVELSRLRVSSLASHLNLQLNNLAMANTDGIQTEEGIIATMFDKSDNHAEYCSDPKCFICEKEEVSVVFLPCAHQVLCLNCSDSYKEKRRPLCPYCSVPIEQHIRVFGAEAS